jgi:hypothetical protein
MSAISITVVDAHQGNGFDLIVIMKSDLEATEEEKNPA